MANPRPTTKTQRPKTSGPSRPQPSQNDAPEVVDPIWLVKAIGITIVAALVCGYLTLCLLFYQGQWQLVLHPVRSTPPPATILGAPFEIVHFGVDDSASPRLTGWWIPAEPSGRYAGETVLFLPSGDGSLADAIPSLAALHGIGVNVFGFDYRGYGQSAAGHPNQHRMTEDTTAAWQYLTVSRGISGSRLIPLGDGVGGSLALRLAAIHPDLPAVILQSPRADLIQTVLDDPRTKSLPVRMLFHEDFEISGALAALRTPKLLILPELSSDGIRQEAAAAADPKMIIMLPSAQIGGLAYRDGLMRFLDQYPVHY